jgi:hypothetical protein
MSTAVLIPFRTGCAHRNANLMYVISRHAENRWPIILGHHTDGPWNKALAVRDALEQTEADVLCIADADVWTDGLPAAVQAVREGAAWAVPHRGVYRLTETATAQYATGVYRFMEEGLETEERPYLGFEGGGITVLRRDVYEDCPLDPRFTGWGGEDDSFGMALRTLHGAPVRPTGYMPLVHLWHPPQERATRSFGSLESRELRKRYARAQGRPDMMRALIEEAACRSQPC